MFKLTFAATLVASLTAFVAAQDAIQGGFVCDYPGTDGYYFSKKLSYWDHANDSCGEEGTLAGVTNRNFFIATDMIRNCIGEDGAAWIGTWDYTSADPQIRKCLTLYVDYEANGGGISVDCRTRRYALCRRKPKRINGPFYPDPLYPSHERSHKPETLGGNDNLYPEPQPHPHPHPQPQPHPHPQPHPYPHPVPPHVPGAYPPVVANPDVIPLPQDVLPNGYHISPVVNGQPAHAPEPTTLHYYPQYDSNGYPVNAGAVPQYYHEKSEEYHHSSLEIEQLS